MNDRQLGAIIGLLTAAEQNVAAARQLLANSTQQQAPEVGEPPSESSVCEHPVAAHKRIPSLGGGSSTICMNCGVQLDE